MAMGYLPVSSGYLIPMKKGAKAPLFCQNRFSNDSAP